MIISLQQNYKEPIVLCLGFFDCMHTGHQQLLQCAKKMAHGAKVALFTFCNNHFEVLKRSTKLIYTFDERVAIYESLGVEVVVSARFDDNFSAVSGADFLKSLCKFNLCGVVCGADFTCGSDLISAEDVKRTLANVCPVEVVDIVKHNGQKVCSTLVRELLLDNKIEQANSFLSEPFFFKGIVVHGRHVGSALGFPTANISIPCDKLAPTGVYLGIVSVKGNEYRAIVNIGNTPTFNETEQKVEAHLLDFDGNLYGENIKISLLKYLRPIRKFESKEQLVAQLQQDIQYWKVNND